MYGHRNVVGKPGRAAWLLLLLSPVSAAAEAPRPNIVLIVCDNLGYGDIEPFGSKLHRTPHLNRMAAEGMKLTHFYSASGVCTPSRAALMTGCYPRRVSMGLTDGAVLRPVSKRGLHPQEITVAEILREAGYATAIFGKWHMGDQPPFLPTRQGFDHYLGIPYSDDMTPRPGKDWPPLPLMRNEEVIQAPINRDLLTKRLTEAAVAWIEEHRQGPFFLYFPECMPGSTRAPFASEPFKGKSQNGPWGDSVEELDWSAGEVLRALKRWKLDEQTLVVWTSDNGAPRRNPPQGSNGPLAGWGYSTAEGGMRVPCLARWPGEIPAGSVCEQLVTMMDLLPTFAHLAGATTPRDRQIDGYNIVPLLKAEPGAKSPYEAFFYYQVDQLQAVRAGRWKLYLPIRRRNLSSGPNRPQPLALYDVVADPGETRNQAAQHADVVRRIKKLAESARIELGDYDQPGRGQRPAGKVDQPTPRVPAR